MTERFEKYRHIARTTFPRHQRGVDLLGIVSLAVLAGVSITGVWQFFAHAPDPSFVDYQSGVDNRLDQAGQTVVSELHDLFATAAGVVALVGTGWFAYRIAHRVPALGLAALTVALFGSLVGSIVRFNIVKIEDRPLTATGPGYLQVFRPDLEYAVTTSGEVGPMVFQLIVFSHVASVPVLVAFGYLSITRAIDRRHDELLNEPKRTWFTGDAGPSRET